MLTSRTARWVAGTTLLCVALLGLSWLLLVSPQRTEAAELRDQNASTQSQNDLLEVKIAQLRAQFAKLPESQAELASILAQMPPDAGMPRLVRDLDAMSESTGVTLSSVTPGPGQTLTTGTAVPGAAAAAPAATAAAGAAAGTTAVDGSTVVAIPVTVAIDGDYFQTVAFLKQLQTQMPCAFLVTAVQMSAGSAGGADASATGGNVAVTITGKVFALPGMSADVLTTGTGTTAGAAGSPMSTATPTTPATTPAAAPTASAPAATATAPAPTATATQEVS